MDLEEIRKKKMEALKQQAQEQQNQEQKQVEIEQQLKSVARQILTDSAFMRLQNVKLVNPALYAKTIQTLMYFVKSNQANQKIDEPELKKLLEKLSGEKKEINIKRK